MKNLATLIALCAVLALASPALATDMTKDNTAPGHAGMDMPAAKTADQGMEGMQHGNTAKGETFVHAAMIDGMHAEFQVMDLAAMNMPDTEGKTHHVMATFMKGGAKVEKAAGKVKLIAPSGKEQTATLKDYGSGVYAANFLIDEPGKWGVICLFKEGDATHTVKFWYPHSMN